MNINEHEHSTAESLCFGTHRDGWIREKERDSVVVIISRPQDEVTCINIYM